MTEEKTTVGTVAENESEVTSGVPMDVQKEKIRNLVKGIYDLQKLRIATGNRIVQSFNIQMGQAPSTKQEDMDEEAKKLIDILRTDYQRITDAYLGGTFSYVEKIGSEKVSKTVSILDKKGKALVDVEYVKEGEQVTTTKKLKKNTRIETLIAQLTSTEDAGIKLIKSKVDYELVGAYMDLMTAEKRMIKTLDAEVTQHPMWDKFFKDVKGCGTLMSAVCIAYFDIHKARHVSSFWKYAGLDTVEVEKEDGTKVREGRSKRHIEMVDYIDKDGETKQKRGITYNPELKTKLIGVLGSSFLRAGSKDNKYGDIYRDYKFRLENRADADEISKLRKHNMSTRYMIKQFVRDMWVTWRALEGYEVTQPYEVAYLHRKPHKYNEYHDRIAHETAKTPIVDNFTEDTE